MNRSEYIQTCKGQLHLHSQRRIKRQYYSIRQQPKSKKSINIREKMEFQQCILKKIQDNKRRAYRSPVIMEIDFNCTHNNSPAIHTLAKNYLDLLSKPLIEIKTKRKKLLYDDDRLVKVLIVNYRQCNITDYGISIKIDCLSSYLQDLKLSESIIHSDFLDKDYYGVSDIEEDDFESNRFNYPHERLKTLKKQKDSYVKIVGLDAYNSMVDLVKIDMQRDYLRIGNISTSGIYLLFAPYLNKQLYPSIVQAIEEIQATSRNILISPPLTLDLKHTPVQEGQTNIFKNDVKCILGDFQKQYSSLFPLKIPIGVIVLFVPPKNQSIDLDNLARYIIPFVNDTFKPPMNYVDSGKSVARYQFVELPRVHSDPKAGYVRLVFDDPFSKNIWDKTDDIIRKWSDKI